MDCQSCARCPASFHLITRHVPFNAKCSRRKPLILAFAARVILLLIVGVLPVTCAAVGGKVDPSVVPPGSRCKGDRNFRIAVEYTWKPLISVGVEQDGPGFMSLLCVAHGPDFELWSVGKVNSPTINGLLQTQNFSTIVGEIKNNMTLNRVKSYNISSTRVVKSPGVDSANVTVSASINATLISCIASITPSPDWFTGISNLEMCPFNRTTNTSAYPTDLMVVDLRTYDAEFNDLETATGESDLLKQARPVTLRLNLGESLGKAQIAVPGRAIVPSQTARGEAARESFPECFPGTAIVEGHDGKVLMRDLVVSQQIRSAANAFSEVFMFSHHDPQIWTQFLTLRFRHASLNQTGALTASRGHYVYLFDDMIDKTRIRLAAMDTIQIGDHLVSTDGSPLRVSGVAMTWQRGLYNPHTIDGDLVVDGVLVSSFTRAVDPEAAKWAMRPLLILYTSGMSRLVQLLTSVLSGRFNFGLARLLPSGR